MQVRQICPRGITVLSVLLDVVARMASLLWNNYCLLNHSAAEDWTLTTMKEKIYGLAEAIDCSSELQEFLSEQTTKKKFV